MKLLWSKLLLEMKRIDGITDALEIDWLETKWLGHSFRIRLKARNAIEPAYVDLDNPVAWYSRLVQLADKMVLLETCA